MENKVNKREKEIQEMKKRKREVERMFEVIKDTYYINDGIDLVYTSYYNTWGFVDYKNDHRVSIPYQSRAEALRAYITNTVKWED